MPEIIAQGAEAILYREGNSVIKDRISKSYRLPEIDEKLRKFRTRREAKVLQKLAEIRFPGPKLIDFSDKDMKINMSFVRGDVLKDVLHRNHAELSRELGRKIGILHKNDIIHHDLTTSNMILNDEIYFIDFGLSFFSKKAEDKATDLHLLDRALESKHSEIYEECIKAALEGYKETYPEHSVILERLKKVQARGRNKGKG